MKDILGYEGLYAIEKDGRVWSYKSKKYIKQWICNNGYYMVKLHKNGEQSNKCVHRLLAEAYLDNPHNYPTVDHIDRNKLNNKLENLRWASYTTQASNMDRTLINMKSSVRCTNGETNPLRKVKRIAPNGTTKCYDSLADAAFDSIGDRTKTGGICAVCQGKQKTCWGFMFEYID